MSGVNKPLKFKNLVKAEYNDYGYVEAIGGTTVEVRAWDEICKLVQPSLVANDKERARILNYKPTDTTFLREISGGSFHLVQESLPNLQTYLWMAHSWAVDFILSFETGIDADWTKRFEESAATMVGLGPAPAIGSLSPSLLYGFEDTTDIIAGRGMGGGMFSRAIDLLYRGRREKVRNDGLVIGSDIMEEEKRLLLRTVSLVNAMPSLRLGVLPFGFFGEQHDNYVNVLKWQDFLHKKAKSLRRAYAKELDE